MDVKVYKKEEVLQPSGSEYVYVPDVIDIIPELIDTETDMSFDVRKKIWNLDNLKKVADVRIENNKLIINSEDVSYSNGILYVTVHGDSIVDAEIVKDGTVEMTEQMCALATIFQKGLDPLDPEDGISWSQAMLDEVNVVQLMAEITDAVSKVSASVTVDFETITDSEGRSYLSYKLVEVA